MNNSFVKETDIKFLEFCEKYKLFHQKKTVIACVSGGVDSMVMLRLLNKFKKKLDYKIIAVHVNHLFRGELSDRDEQLVTEICQKMAIRLHVKRYDVEKFALENSISFEMAGRQLRYEFFHEIAEEYDHAVIATAHIKDDQAETLLLRIIKGTGANGLRGIAIKRGLIIRPVLFAEKDDLYKYAKTCGIPFNEDHTNFENNCQRNIIRNKILPIIKTELNPGIDESLIKLASMMSDQLDFIKEFSRNKFSEITDKTRKFRIDLDGKELAKTNRAIRNEILLMGMMKLDPTILTFPAYHFMEKIENLIFHSKTGNYIAPVKNIIILKNRDYILLLNTKIFQWDEIKVHPGKIYKEESFIFSSEFNKFEDFSKINNSSEIEYVDFEKIKGNLKLRHWQKGDRFVPFGKTGHKKLSDFFIDNKVPRFVKESIPVLTDEEKIVWVCGMRLSGEVRISKHSQKILKLEYKEI